MSRSGRNREAVAPTLFPFLAVLLCTMGSLVLILMLIVSGAQAKTQEIAQETRERQEEKLALVELAQETLNENLADVQFELEKKRLHLGYIEEHIQSLVDELEALEQQANLLDQQSGDQVDTQEQIQVELSELEKQLADAKEKLNQKTEDPDGDKPIFAVIPYEGSSGTHRRPIYLECTAAGVVIQPEDTLVPFSDLRPPYGPGNPLDAALRTIRTAFPNQSGAVTRAPYPLLIVRPNGVETYTRARAAMMGWDDQFGYELIDDELELTYPPSKPGLKSKIEKALSLARERQAALIAAMPNKFRRIARVADSASSPNTGGQGAFGAGSSTTGSGLGDGLLGGVSQGGSSPDSLFASAANGDSGNGDAGASWGSTDSFGKLTQSAGLRPTADSATSWGPIAGPSNGTASGAAASQNLLNGSPVQIAEGPHSRDTSAGDDSRSPDLLGHHSADQHNPDTEYPSIPSGSGSQNQPDSNNLASSVPGAAATGNGMDSQGNQASGPSTSASTATGSSNLAAPSPGSQTFAVPNLPNFAGGASPASGSPSDPSQFDTGQSRPPSSLTNGPQSGAQGASNPAAQQTGATGNQLSSVSSMHGRGWAWKDGPPTQTEVIRRIGLVCETDRWILPSENRRFGQPIVIPFTGIPQERAAELAKAIRNRVSGWGLAVAGGYWKPILSVRVAPDAEWRFEQLKQLFAGSGLDIELAPRRVR